MNNEISVKYGDELAIQRFRLFCLDAGITNGVVWEDDIPYYLNEYAVFTGEEPKTLVDIGRLISAIVRLQIKKRSERKNSA